MKAETINQKYNPNDKSSEYAQYEIIGHCLLIRLKKELDHHCASYVKERSDYLIDKRRIKNVIFDFEKSMFMDSSGIGVIMGRYKRVIFTGGKVAVCNVNKAVDRVFELSGLYKIIQKYSTTGEAIKELKDTEY